MGSEVPISTEHMVPMVMRIVSVLSANWKREQKLVLGGVDTPSATGWETSCCVED